MPLIVCNRSRRGRESRMAEAENLTVDRAMKLLALSAADSAHSLSTASSSTAKIAACEVAASLPVAPEPWHRLGMRLRSRHCRPQSARVSAR